MNGIASFSGLSLAHPGNFEIQVQSGSAAPATIGPINVTAAIRLVCRSTRAAADPPAPVVLGEQLVFAGKGKNRYVAGIVLTFSSALDPATAGNSSNYSVVQATKVGRPKADQARPAARRLQAAANNAVKLTFVRQAPVHGWRSALADCLRADRHRQLLRSAPRRQHGKPARRECRLHDSAKSSGDQRLIPPARSRESAHRTATIESRRRRQWAIWPIGPPSTRPQMIV